MSEERLRLDEAIARSGLLPSRSRARDAIRRGTVTVNGTPATKPGRMVAAGDEIAVADPAGAYVSRGALKLIAGLDAGGVEVADRVCLDIGASTGGFTQVLLERGARRVHAVDVGHGQLDPALRDDPRVAALEGVNARELTRAEIPEPVEVLACDVSFVSVAKVLGPALALCAPDAAAVVLVKPQFEAGPAHVGRGGIVADPAARMAARDAVVAFMAGEGFALAADVPSPIAGGAGNLETVAVFRRGGGSP